MPDRKRRRDPTERFTIAPLSAEEGLRRLLGGEIPVDPPQSDTGLLGGVDEANEDLDALEPEVSLEEPEPEI
jgi:hypothetical protein